MSEDVTGKEQMSALIPTLSKRDVDHIHDFLVAAHESGFIAREMDSHVISRLYYGAIGAVINERTRTEKMEQALREIANTGDTFADAERAAAIAREVLEKGE
jgi:hypothetical protein